MKILDTFQPDYDKIQWQGPFSRGKGELPDGETGALASGRISTRALPQAWSGFRSLQYTVYNADECPQVGGVFILDKEGENSPERDFGDFVDRGRSLMYPQGVTHVVIDLDPIQTTQGDRMLDLSHVMELGLSFSGINASQIVIANLRLSEQERKPDADARAKPGDSVMHMKHMDIECYVYQPELFQDPEDVVDLRRKLEQETELLKKAIDVAQLAGKQTQYEELPVFLSDIALKARAALPWHFSPDRKRANFSEALTMVSRMRKRLEQYLGAVIHEDDEDDSNLPIPTVRDVPALKSLRIKGKAFVNNLGEPILVCSMNYHHTGRLMRFFAPDNHRVELYAVGGGSRYDIETSPVYRAFHASEKAKRVGWRGWCGHLIKDQWAMGGRKENVVICLEHKPILKAIKEYNRMHANEWRGLPQLLYVILAYELMYICYCDESIRRFRKWLQAKHKTIRKLNVCWGTQYKSFKQATPPPSPDRGPAPDANRAAWYEWADWNTRRFTDHLKWSKRSIRELDKNIPICAGGTSSMFSPSNSTTGIDEELIINEVDDVILHEGGDLMGIDLAHAVCEKPKPIVDPEHGGTSENWMLNYLHGKNTLAKFYWPKQPSRHFPHQTLGSPQHGMLPLSEVEEELRIALDVRRLNLEITAFWDIPRQVAIHYSKTNILQVPPALITARVSPYLLTMRTAYDTCRFLDAAPTFVSECMLLKGRIKGIKVIVLPGCRHLRKDVFRRLNQFVKTGGALVLLPELPVADEYNKPAGYLNEWGIQVKKSHVMQIKGMGEFEQGYDQNLDRNVSFGSGKKVSSSKTDATFFGRKGTVLKTAGVFHEITAKGWKIIAQAKAGPMVAGKALGKGSVYVFAGMPEEKSLGTFLDCLYSKIGVERRLKVTDPKGNRIHGMEARLVRQRLADLVYVSNTNHTPVKFKVQTDREWYKVRELRSLEYWKKPEGKLAPKQTILLSLIEDPVRAAKRKRR